MISLQTLHRGSARAAGRYYADQKDDYYRADGGAAQWQGKGAERAGLSGAVSPEQFVAAMQGDLGAEVALSRSIRKDAKGRAGIDVTFSAPKSVSIQALVGRDGTVLAAHDHAVTKALEFLERELIIGRQKQNGESSTEKTGNAIIAKFRHETARPTEFDEADPQLHTHSIIMNATQRSDGKWVAISNENLYRSKKMLDLIYKSEMAAYLEKAGYALRHEKDNFELAHLTREQIEHFSKRGMTVESELAKLGKTRKSASHKLKQTITLATREDKRPAITRDELQARWEHDAKAMQMDLERMHLSTQMERGVAPTDSNFMPEAFDGEGVELAVQPHPKTPTPSQLEPKRPRHGPGLEAPIAPALRSRIAVQSIDWAIRHLSEREAVMTESTIMDKALTHSMGSGATYWQLKQALADSVKSGHLVQGAPVYRSDLGGDDRDVLSRAGWVEKMMNQGATREEAQRNVRRAIATGALVLDDVHYTTQAAREREKRILQIEREGRGAMTSIYSPEDATKAVEGKNLTPGQLAAAQLMLSSTNRVVGVQGLAGVGKSFMLSHVKEAMEDAGYTVKSIAPYSTQVEQLRTLNMESVTVASFLSSRQNRFTMDEKTVLVIDEAAVVPTRQMEKILQRAEEAGARVVMLGDKDQTKAIEAGRPMHQLQEAGMQTALMGDIQRQTNPILKEAVELAAPGHARAALHVLDSKLNAVEEIQDESERYARISKHYVSLPHETRRDTLIVTGTNKSRNTINQMIHEGLGLAGKGFDYTLLTRVDTTQAQRRSAKYFQEGNIIQPERDYKVGLRSDSQYLVVHVDASHNRLDVIDTQTGMRLTFNPARTTKLSVYEPVKRELSAGDLVRVTRNDAKLDLRNGDRFEVLSVTPTTVKIGTRDERGKVVSSTVLKAGKRDSLHLDLAYVSTVHGSQGLSATGVILNQETYSRTTKSDVFYVAISRAREAATVYTDDVTKLPAAVSRREKKSAALDIGIVARQRNASLARSHGNGQKQHEAYSL